ncbi:hypothetical protein MMC25_001896 [Agyrium rufum]|nr:hypothetical protein [Agyrium rufum]
MIDPEPDFLLIEEQTSIPYNVQKPSASSRNPRTSKRGAYLEGIEDRIKRMESAIVTSRLHGTAEPVDGIDEEKSSSEKLESQAELSDQLSSLVVNLDGSPNFIGWASGFSLLSPQGTRWISEKVGGQDELAQLMHGIANKDYGQWGRGNTDLWFPVPRPQHSSLPSKDIASRYVSCFFITFNSVFPVLNQRAFNAYFEQQYSSSPPAGAAWYALFNAVLCIGSIKLKAEQEKHTRKNCLVDYTSTAQEVGARYFRHASSCFHDLFFNKASLMAMQAMTLMVRIQVNIPIAGTETDTTKLFITRSSPNPQPAYVIASAAGSLATTLGLHRSLDGFGLGPEEIEQRRNVFWVFYLMEKPISQNLGRPSIINDDDIAVELPSKQPRLIRSPSGARVYDIFQDQVKLAIIGSRIYSELYSASSQTKSQADRIKVLGQLDAHLQRWRDAMPLDIRPEYSINCSDEQYVPVVMMHFIYLDAVIMLHRISSHRESYIEDETAEVKTANRQSQLSPRLYGSQLLCLAAARRSIQLLDTFSNNNLHNQHLMWMALYYPLSASLVLFTNVLSNPRGQHATSDIHLMGLITSFITQFVQPGTSFAATPTLSMFKELYGIATRFMERVSPQLSQRTKQKPEYDDTVQSDLVSTPSVHMTPSISLWSGMNTEHKTKFAPQDSAISYPEIDILASNPFAAYGDNEIRRGDQDEQSITSLTYSQDSTGNSPLEFAPFLASQPDQFDYTPMLFDSLPSPTGFEWDTDNMWMPSFATE